MKTSTYVMMAAVAVVAMMAIALSLWTQPAEGQQTPPPTLVSMADGTIAHSDTLAINIVGSTFPQGLSGFSIRVSTGDPAIAEAFQFTSPDYGLVVLDATSTPGSLRLGVADLNGVVEPGAVDVVLGTVVFLGRAEGVTPIRVSIEGMADEVGTTILTSVSAGVVKVSDPRDLDGDGITEDINGNGAFDFADILLLFEMLLAFLAPP